MPTDTLKNKLDDFAKKFLAQAPDEVIEVVKAKTTELGTWLRSQAYKEKGDIAPAFELPAADGTMVNSESLLKDGPMVLTFYRGGW